MPPAMSYLPPDNPKRYSGSSGMSLNGANEERRLLEEHFLKAEKYYEGDQPKPLGIPEDGVDDNVIVNVTKQAVDRTLSFLFPAPFRLVTDVRLDNSPQEAFLSDVLLANGGEVFWDGVAYNGALAGHNFVRVLPVDPDNERNSTLPRLVNYAPGSVIAYWKADDKEKVLWYEIKWQAMGDNYVQDVRREKIVSVGVDEKAFDGWVIDTYQQIKGTSRYTLLTTEYWPYALCPIVDWPHIPQTNKFYGSGEVSTDQMQLNNSINRVMSDMSRILRFHAFPKTIGIGINAEEIQPTSVDGLWTTENSEANIFNLEMKSDLASSMNMAQYLSDAFLAQARVVIMRGTVKDFQRVTNTGIRAVFLDMIAKNQLIRSVYGDAIQRIAQRLLLLGGFAPVRPDIIWPDPLPQDDTEAVNTLAIERGLRIVSRETASKQRGYDWDDEKSMMENEAKLEMFQSPESNAGGSAGDGAGSTDGSALGKTDKNRVET